MAEDTAKPKEQGAENPAQTQPEGGKPAESGSDNPYKTELDRVNAENAELREAKKAAEEAAAKKEGVIGNKNKRIEELIAKLEDKVSPAIDEETVTIDGVEYAKKDIDNFKKVAKAVGLPPNDEFSSLKEDLREVRKFIQESAEEKHISEVSTNDEEAKLIRFHLDNTLKRSGDVKKDVEVARLLANRHLLAQAEEREEESRLDMASRSGRGASGGRSRPETGDASTRAAIKILKTAEPDKDWNKYL